MTDYIGPLAAIGGHVATNIAVAGILFGGVAALTMLGICICCLAAAAVYSARGDA